MTKKKNRSVFCAILAVMMVSCLSVSAVAAPPVEIDELPQTRGEAIGTHAEEDGILLEDRATTASGLPFSMRAVGVSKLLTTYSSTGKNFTGGAFDVDEGLLIQGTVTHTLGYDVKVGACYYKKSNDTFYSVDYSYFKSGVQSSGFTPKFVNSVQFFYNQETYYGHITNYQGDGEVSGTLSFSVAKNPL